MTTPSVGIAVITHNARHHLAACLPPLINSPLKPKILVVNSSSSDGTVELAKQFGVETLIIPRKSFNHGTTRELARHALDCEIAVMVTPDAYAVDRHVLEKLIAPIVSQQAALSYARQLPHEGADFFETFLRTFNYPEKSAIRSLADAQRLGATTFFCSDSFAAYRNSALNEIGGFPEVLTGEDTVACAKLLHRGHRVAYVAEAEVKHSHRYTLLQEFKRHFDTGLARRSYQELIHLGCSDQKRGAEYAKTLLKELLSNRPTLLPYACLHLLAKWSGYKLGEKSLNASISFKSFFSAQDFYWQSEAVKK